MFNCLIWAMKHDLPNIFDIGLDVIDVILEVIIDLKLVCKQRLGYCQLILLIILFGAPQGFTICIN